MEFFILPNQMHLQEGMFMVALLQLQTNAVKKFFTMWLACSDNKSYNLSFVFFGSGFYALN